MPWDEVMPKFGKGQLHSGSKTGPKVKSKGQALAIMLSEKRKAQGGKKEYQSKKKKGGFPFKKGGGKKAPVKAQMAGMML